MRVRAMSFDDTNWRMGNREKEQNTQNFASVLVGLNDWLTWRQCDCNAIQPPTQLIQQFNAQHAAFNMLDTIDSNANGLNNESGRHSLARSTEHIRTQNNMQYSSFTSCIF